MLATVRILVRFFSRVDSQLRTENFLHIKALVEDVTCERPPVGVGPLVIGKMALRRMLSL